MHEISPQKHNSHRLGGRLQRVYDAPKGLNLIRPAARSPIFLSIHFLHRPVVASERVPSFGVAIASKVSTCNTRPAIRCCPMTNVTLPVQPARPMSSVRLTTSAASRCSTLLLFWLHLLSSADCLPRRPIYPDEDMQRVLFTCMWC